MQITINIPDELPANIVQQYISNIEAQMSLLMKMAKENTSENKPVSLKRGSAKNIITFIADDFTAPLDDFKDYM
jgi:hypothetical protein